MRVRIYDDIQHHDVVRSWKRITRMPHIFPQSSYEWCSVWWRYQSGNRRLRLISVVANNGDIVAIAPMCVETQFGMPVLRSFPIHFGDFYSFIVDEGIDQRKVIDLMLSEMQTFSCWSLIQIDQVLSNDVLARLLSEKGFEKIERSNVYSIDLPEGSMDDFLCKLSRNMRRNLRKKKNRLERDFSIDMLKLSSYWDYLRFFEATKEIYNRQWGSPLPDRYYQCRNEALYALFQRNQAMMYILMANRRPISFTLTILHANTLFLWKTGWHLEYERYSPGNVLLYYMTEDAQKSGLRSINHMAGDYPYKVSWTRGGNRSQLYTFLQSSGPKGHLLRRYHLRWRPNIKVYARKIIRTQRVKLF